MADTEFVKKDHFAAIITECQELIDDDENYDIKYSPESKEGAEAAIEYILKRMKDIPSADVRPVVHGRWIKDESGVVICSECGEEHAWEIYRATYCDECGAKMDEDDT